MYLRSFGKRKGTIETIKGSPLKETTTPKSLNQSRKSFKSIVVDSNNRQKSISINENEVLSLPSKTFYQGDGTQMSMIGRNKGLNEKPFSPLISYLLRQRNRAAYTNMS